MEVIYTPAPDFKVMKKLKPPKYPFRVKYLINGKETSAGATTDKAAVSFCDAINYGMFRTMSNAEVFRRKEQFSKVEKDLNMALEDSKYIVMDYKQERIGFASTPEDAIEISTARALAGHVTYIYKREYTVNPSVEVLNEETK